MVNGKAKVDQDLCIGCGHCSQKCPNNAISVEVDDPKRYDELISLIESHVDVT
ncbi:MAG: 4Fe-4S dicluster domain-containing protein [archaeon]|nr:4Fe-4S dicluster domain-containing protein [archaeon]